MADELDYHLGWIAPVNFSADLYQDLRYGRRVLRKPVGFTLTATLVLGLGIGVPLTALRGSLNDIPQRWMRDPGSLAILTRRGPHSANALLPYPEMQFFADRARSFRSLMGMSIEEEDFATQAGQQRERIPVAFVTANYFQALGSRAANGRALSPQIDGTPNAECAAVLSHGFWQRRLGGDHAIVGRQLLVNGKPVRVVGITPAGFFGIQDDNVSIWLPMERQPEFVDGSDLLISWQRGIRAYARLMPGVTETSIRHETAALMADLWTERPADFQEGEWMSSQSVRKLLSPENLLGTLLVALILIVACANLGNLLLARGVMRQREIQTRMALGASRFRVVRQLFTEALLLALFGGLAAIALSALFVRCLQLLAGETPTESIVPAWPIAGATASIALLAAVIFGLLPAFRVTGPSPRAGRSRTVFLASQAAASCLLLMLSGLLVHGAIRRIAADPGFDYQHVVWIAPNLQSHGLRGASAAYMAALKDRLREIPQVRSVSIASSPPLSRDGAPHINRVDSDYLQTLGVGLVRGRMFLAGEAGVAVVSPEVAARFWHGEDPLGRRVPVENAIVVGVTASAPSSDPAPGRSHMDVYVPSQPKDAELSVVMVRVSGKPEDYVRRIEETARSIDPRIRSAVHIVHAEYERSMRNRWTGIELFGALGTIAVLLAAIGLAGLTGYLVAQRTREIGVRMALGANRAQVVEAVLRPAALALIVGLAAGIPGAAALGAIMRSELAGLSPLDPATYASATAIFTAVMALAALAPARRAMRVNPSEALRHE